MASTLLSVIVIIALIASFPIAASLMRMAAHHFATLAMILVFLLALYILVIITRMTRAWFAGGDWQTELRKSIFRVTKLLSGQRH